MRERRPNGNDTCVNGHVYPSSDSIMPSKGKHNTKPILLENPETKSVLTLEPGKVANDINVLFQVRHNEKHKLYLHNQTPQAFVKVKLDTWVRVAGNEWQYEGSQQVI